MSDFAIRAVGLGKLYRLGERAGYRMARDILAGAARAARECLLPSAAVPPDSAESLWAVEDVSFTVERGSALGIIGRNGAGKSTLLKILSRITAPTRGYAEIEGRVGALLEVGTGFHKELTGRENVYFNGAVLGMKRAEIRRRFDEIVGFAEIERFIDTPVKRYSTGMVLRLAFAVAAHLDQEVLLADEILAVGDGEFQKRCLGRMRDLAGSGRTVLFVSHNLGAVRSLCSTALYLEAGRVKRAGGVDEVIGDYLSATSVTANADFRAHPNRARGARPVISDFNVFTGAGEGRVGEGGVRTATSTVMLGAPVVFEISLDANGKRIENPSLDVTLTDAYGNVVCVFKSLVQSGAKWDVERLRTLRCDWPVCQLVPGRYGIGVALCSDTTVEDQIDDVAELHVVDRDIFGSGRTGYYRTGAFVPAATWTVSS